MEKYEPIEGEQLKVSVQLFSFHWFKYSYAKHHHAKYHLLSNWNKLLLESHLISKTCRVELTFWSHMRTVKLELQKLKCEISQTSRWTVSRVFHLSHVICDVHIKNVLKQLPVSLLWRSVKMWTKMWSFQQRSFFYQFYCDRLPCVGTNCFSALLWTSADCFSLHHIRRHKHIFYPSALHKIFVCLINVCIFLQEMRAETNRRHYQILAIKGQCCMHGDEDCEVQRLNGYL